MYRYILDIRYAKNVDSDEPCLTHNFLQQKGYNLKVLQDTNERTEVEVEFQTIKEADNFASDLVHFKKELSSKCSIDCYVVTNKWTL